MNLLSYLRLHSSVNKYCAIKNIYFSGVHCFCQHNSPFQMALPLIALKFTYKIKQLFENSRKGNKGKKKTISFLKDVISLPQRERENVQRRHSKTI